MPSTIPYNPNLTLANIVSKDALDNIVDMAKANADVDAAQEHLNSLMMSRRSLDMTKAEIENLGSIPVDKINASIEVLNGKIADVGGAYVDAKVAAEDKLQELRAKIIQVHVEQESPVDYVKTQIKTMALAADSISMDVQYFSADVDAENSKALGTKVAGMVSASTSWMGVKVSTQASTAAQKQVDEQTTRHSIAGTLVMSVTCSHKNAAILAPFVLNVDKAIKVWNHLHADDPINPTSTKGMTEMTQPKDAKEGEEPKKFSIISGMTFGSSFVGMVHVLNVSDTKASEDLSAYTTTLQAQMTAGSWYEEASGGFGVVSSVGNDIKNLLSSQNVTSHVTMTCMGVIPSVVANEVQLGVKQFATFDPKANMEAIATIQNATNADQNSVNQAAEAARTGQKMLTMKANDIKAALSALADVDDGKNKILDINSMMTALEDYIKKAAAGDCGVPINFYLKDITKDMIAQMWVAKYYPGKYMAINYDDAPPEKKDDEHKGDNPA